MDIDSNDPTSMATHWMALLIGRVRITVDNEFGPDFAESNPALVGELVGAGMNYISTMNLASKIEAITPSVETIAAKMNTGD